jgi:hypothetical protein
VKSRSTSLLGIVFGIALAGAPLSPAGAVNINTSATACQQAVFQAVPSDKQNRVGIIDAGVVNMANVPTIVICPVPRSPLAAGATSGGFWLDGDNFLNSLVTVQTSCNVASYTFQGVLHGWSGFTATEATYDRFVSLPASMLGFYDYVSVHCLLPQYHDDLRTYLGVFRGVTASQ